MGKDVNINNLNFDQYYNSNVKNADYSAYDVDLSSVLNGSGSSKNNSTANNTNSVFTSSKNNGSLVPDATDSSYYNFSSTPINISSLPKNDLDFALNSINSTINSSSAVANYGSKEFFNTLLDSSAIASLNSLKYGGSVGSTGSTNGLSSNTKVNNASAGSFGGTSLNQTQVSNAKTIVETGVKKGMSERDIIIAVATALQESSLGADCPSDGSSNQDHDSVGVFQQRPSCGWGSISECEDTAHAASTFYDHLSKVSNRDSMSVTQAAQKVQGSAYPDAYAKWESTATALVKSMIA